MPESKRAEHLIWHILLYPALDPARTIIIPENHKHIICVPQTFNGTKELPDAHNHTKWVHQCNPVDPEQYSYSHKSKRTHLW
jgi:hypothetical protein